MATFLDDIGDFLGLNRGKATVKAAEQNKDVLGQLGDTGRPIIQGIQDTTSGLLDLGKSGATTYADALGLNGAGGNASALEKFQAGPGYQFGLDQGLQALQRSASSQGRLQSGNTDIDLLQYGVGAANNEYGNWLSNLSGYNGMYEGGVDRSNAAAGLGLDFESGLSSGFMGANNQVASGKEAGQGAGIDLLSSIAGIAGNAMGYGGFGGTKPLNGSVAYK